MSECVVSGKTEIEKAREQMAGDLLKLRGGEESVARGVAGASAAATVGGGAPLVRQIFEH